MKRRFIIILSIQSVLILLMWTFAVVQKARADEQRMIAISERARAEKLQYALAKIKAAKENDRNE